MSVTSVRAGALRVWSGSFVGRLESTKVFVMRVTARFVGATVVVVVAAVVAGAAVVVDPLEHAPAPNASNTASKLPRRPTDIDAHRIRVAEGLGFKPRVLAH